MLIFRYEFIVRKKTLNCYYVKLILSLHIFECQNIGIFFLRKQLIIIANSRYRLYGRPDLLHPMLLHRGQRDISSSIRSYLVLNASLFCFSRRTSIVQCPPGQRPHGITSNLRSPGPTCISNDCPRLS